MKPGWQTTEFWTKVPVIIAGLAASSGAIAPDMAKDISDGMVEAVQIINAVVDGILRLGGLAISAHQAMKYGTQRSALKAKEITK